MAFVEKAYLAEYSSVSTQGNVVMEAQEGFFVRLETTDIAVTGGAGMMYRAILAAQLPAPWSPHPIIPNVNAISYSPQPQGNTSAIVLVRYVNVQPQITIRGGCGLKVEDTDIDRLGVPVVVSNQNASATPPVSAAQAIPIGGTHKVMRPEATILIERIRPSLAFGGGAAVDPAAQAVEYVGKTNSTTYFGAAPGTLLCENIGYDNDGFGNVAWRMQYEFRYNRKGWNPRVVWINPETGQPGTQLQKAPGFDAGTVSNSSDPQYGRKVIDDYEQVSFNALLA